MEQPSTPFPQIYHLALRAHLARRGRPDPEDIGKTGSAAKSRGIPVLDIAILHEQLLVKELLPNCAAKNQATLIRRSAAFFAEVIAVSAEDSSTARLNQTIASLSARSVEQAAANRQLVLEIERCGDLEAALRKSERVAAKISEKCESLRERSRELSRQILTAQEEERKKISRELHDVIAQALAGINLRLAALKAETGVHSKQLVRNISLTQNMITKTAAVVHRFARELRPAVLDDFGLIPALDSFMTEFKQRTGVRARLTVFKEVEDISAVKRTVLYRIAQEALTNVGRHACASRVEVSIRRQPEFVRMEITDDGKSFDVCRVRSARGAKRLGLVGMRERVEMVGGHFEIESAPGDGTKIIAVIPVSKATAKRWREESDKPSTARP